MSPGGRASGRGDCWLYIKFCVVVSPNGTLLGVHGTRRMFYVYKDTVVIRRVEWRGYNFTIFKKFRVV